MNHDPMHKVNRLLGLAMTIERDGMPELDELDEATRAAVIAKLPTALVHAATALLLAVPER